MASDHRDILERELLNVGIKPDIETTGSGHLRFRFVAGGKPKSLLTSQTPSDHRSTLNARATIRRILREAGVFAEQRQRPTPIQKALSLPIGVDPISARVERMEADMTALLDIVADLTSKVGKTLAPPPAPQIAVVGKAPALGKKARTLLLDLEYSWMSVDEIQRRDGRSKAALSVALNGLKQRGFVENGERGQWRKRIQPSNGQVATAHATPAGPKAKVAQPNRRGSRTDAVLRCIDYGWTSLADIKKRDGGHAVSTHLSTLKGLGLVERGNPGQWRRLRKNGAHRANGRDDMRHAGY